MLFGAQRTVVSQCLHNQNYAIAKLYELKAKELMEDMYFKTLMA